MQMFISQFKRFSRFLAVLLVTTAVNNVLAHGDGDSAKFGNSKAGEQGASCVRAGSEMRRIHMDLILHQRDKTVRKGMRDTTDSIKECIACHVKYDDKQQPIPVNAEGQFCSHCHKKVATNLDCFECHSTVPREKTASLTTSEVEAISMDIQNQALIEMISSLAETKSKVELNNDDTK